MVKNNKGTGMSYSSLYIADRIKKEFTKPPITNQMTKIQTPSREINNQLPETVVMKEKDGN